MVDNKVDALILLGQMRLHVQMARTSPHPLVDYENPGGRGHLRQPLQVHPDQPPIQWAQRSFRGQPMFSTVVRTLPRLLQGSRESGIAFEQSQIINDSDEFGNRHPRGAHRQCQRPCVQPCESAYRSSRCSKCAIEVPARPGGRFDEDLTPRSPAPR